MPVYVLKDLPPPGNKTSKKPVVEGFPVSRESVTRTRKKPEKERASQFYIIGPTCDRRHDGRGPDFDDSMRQLNTKVGEIRSNHSKFIGT